MYDWFNKQIREGVDMARLVLLTVVMAFLVGCSSPARFIQTDDSFVPAPKPRDAKVMFSHDKAKRPHHVIGIIEAVLGKHARRPELDALMIKKAREIGADGVMMVQYDVNRNVYIETHHKVIGHGPGKRYVVGKVPRADVKKVATGIAIVFD